MSLDQLPFNWFDLLLVIVVIVGLQRGRKRGMSQELLTLLRWMALVVVCASFYEPVGRAIANNSVFSLLFSYIVAYLALALGVAILFSLITRALGGKLMGSDAFGSAEYYLGMLSGLVRFACMLLAALALLNAREFSTREVKAWDAFTKDVYGSDFFPTLYATQSAVFQKSFSGPWIKKDLGFLLIRPTPYQNKEIKRRELELP